MWKENDAKYLYPDILHKPHPLDKYNKFLFTANVLKIFLYIIENLEEKNKYSIVKFHSNVWDFFL